MATPPATPDDASPHAARLEEITPGVHAWIQPDGSWWINNAGAVTDTTGTIVIDTCATEERTRRFLTTLTTATGGAPLHTAVNTHHHGDHTYGNSLLPATTTIIGHEHMRRSLLADTFLAHPSPYWQPAPSWGDLTLRPPTRTIRDELVLTAGRTRVELHHPGASVHTGGDLVVWLPRQRVLFTGDLLFHRVTPMIASGTATGALRGLNWLSTFPARHVIPGHGRPIDAADLPRMIADHERYYRLVLHTAHNGVRRGLTPLQAALDCDLAEFATWTDSERIVINLHRVYTELTRSPYDTRHALADTLVYNGGPLHTSV
ncbi:MBL fold metallo-hydrolase [Marinactinospora endophytica]